MIYDINGNEITIAYDIKGNVLNSVCNIDGNDIAFLENTLLDSAMLYCDNYVKENPNSYTFPLITDVHLNFKGNEPQYIVEKYPNTWSRILFLGDMVNNYDTTDLNNAVSFMRGASGLNKIVAIGNHELCDWAEGNTLPDEFYKSLLDSTSVLWNGGDGLIYYSDDEEKNVRYIVLDSCTPIYKSSGTQLFTLNELEWCASIMEASDGKDIIICNHAIGTSFYLVTDTNKETRKYDTTITNASTKLFPMINAFINKESYSITDDEGVLHTHDFSTTTGKFIGYFSGHYHNAGLTDENGFLQFTCPMLRTTYSGYPQAMNFFIIDKTLQKIIWLVCDYSKETYDKYEYQY